MVATFEEAITLVSGVVEKILNQGCSTETRVALEGIVQIMQIKLQELHDAEREHFEAARQEEGKFTEEDTTI